MPKYYALFYDQQDFNSYGIFYGFKIGALLIGLQVAAIFTNMEEFNSKLVSINTDVASGEKWFY